MRKIIIGIFGPGETATPSDRENAYNLGQLVARQDWILLTGGRKVGVMDAASRGAKSAGGLTIGILPGNDSDDVSDAVDLAIATGLGNARNSINALTARVAVACGMGLGTASEVALALKNGRKVILLNSTQAAETFFLSLAPELISIAKDPESAIDLIKYILKQ